MNWRLMSLLLRDDRDPPFFWRSLGKASCIFLAGMLLIHTDTEEQKLSDTLLGILHFDHSQVSFF